MKNFATVCSFLLAIVLVIAAPVRADKSYSIGPVQIEAWLQQDGALLVEERRSYDFDGSFHYAFRSLPLREGVRYSDFAIEEADQAYVEREDDDPGVFTVKQEEGLIEVRWYFSADDERRTFIFRYRLEGAVARHEDAAVFYYQFIGRDWSQKQKEVTLTLHPPQEESGGEVLHWLHGPLWARSAIQPSGRITATCAELPARTYLEVRALYPPEWFPGMAVAAGEVRSAILAEEASWAAKANALREKEEAKQAVRAVRRVEGRYYAGLLAFIGLGIWYFFYRNYGKRPAIHDYVPKESPEIPDETPPALVSYLLNSRIITSGALLATLYDLARRGFVEISESTSESRGFFSGKGMKRDYLLSLQADAAQKRRSELQEYESGLLDFIFHDLAGGENEISLKTFGKHALKVQSFFSKWQVGVKKAAEAAGWYDKRSLSGMHRAMLCCGAGMVASLLLLIWYAPWPAVAAALFLALLISAYAILHRTEEGERRFRRWKALSRYMRSKAFLQTPQGSLLDRIDRYFVYAPVLGAGKPQYQALASQIPAGQNAHYLPWFIYTSGDGAAGGADSFAQAFTAMTTTMSSSGGVGGGASVGGGGGAGGGGGGAG